MIRFKSMLRLLTVSRWLLYNPPSVNPGASATMGGSAIQRPLAIMMTRRVLTVAPGALAVDAARTMRDAKVGALLVSDGSRYVGILSESDLVRKVLAAEREARSVPVSEVMMAPIITIEIDRSAHEASDLMAERGIRHLAVTEDGQIVGMLSVRDLLRYFKNWGTL
jgi:CBS domain-containing protein